MPFEQKMLIRPRRSAPKNVNNTKRQRILVQIEPNKRQLHQL